MHLTRATRPGSPPEHKSTNHATRQPGLRSAQVQPEQGKNMLQPHSERHLCAHGAVDRAQEQVATPTGGRGFLGHKSSCSHQLRKALILQYNPHHSGPTGTHPSTTHIPVLLSRNHHLPDVNKNNPKTNTCLDRTPNHLNFTVALLLFDKKIYHRIADSSG